MSRSIDVIILTHVGGTKDYVLTVMNDENGDSAILRRNGKVGTRGQMQRASRSSYQNIRSELNEEITKRVKRDYKTTSSKRAYTLSQLQDIIRGQAWGDTSSTIWHESMLFFENQIVDDLADAYKESSESVERGEEWGSW
tara:strand:- start:9634 stop:10053 length:420 start_codon:yes stop_codon:yes gene_type:complete